MKPFTALLLLPLLCAPAWPQTRSWSADNGNGTYSNPLFYDEFSDPDMIRVGSDFYLTGTTMHTMPGLPVLHSRDLVNWRLISYAFERLDLGPEFRLEGGREAYGQGIWAPSFRHHNGTFYIFANVNRHGLQVFRSNDPRGPWKHNRIEQSLHDLSVLFDDDGKIYAVYGARTIRIVELNAGLTAVVPGTDRVLFERDRGMGEGAHFYKIQGKYYIVSAIPGAHTPMMCARADRIDGTWEVTTISEKESLGIGLGYRLKDQRRTAPPFEITPPNPAPQFGLTLHQGGIIDTPSGEWWGYSMQDHNSVGRLTCLSPVTWKDGWPYFGLPGNLTRTPSSWVKPATGRQERITAPYDRSDEFPGPKLQPVWQWNHAPDDAKWSLSERAGYLRLHSLPAPDFWMARNSLTQRAIGPESEVTTELETGGMKAGDVAGLALLNLPYAWIGVSRRAEGFVIEQYDHTTGSRLSVGLPGTRVWLRAHCDFDTEKARFSFSADGKVFQPLGEEFTMVFQLKTFQGVRYALFHYNTGGAPGGHADFNRFTVVEPRPRGLTRPIPVGQRVSFASLADGKPLTVGNASSFRVVDRGRGRVTLQAGGEYLSVTPQGALRLKAGSAGDTETFQWIDLQRGDVLLLSLATNRYVIAPVDGGEPRGDHAGPAPNRRDGSCFRWEARPAQ